MSLVGFQASKIWIFFGKLFMEQVLKSFSGRNNSLKPLLFRFCNSLPYNLEESIELRVLIVTFWVYRHSKMQKNLLAFFCVYLSCHYGFTNYFDILIFLFPSIIPGGIPTFQILSFQDQHLQKYRAQKFVEFSFLVFLANCFKNVDLKPYCTLKIVLLNSQNNFYVIMSSYAERHVQKKKKKKK